METYSGTIPADCLLYFTASWCAPCAMMKPVFARLTDVRIVVVDVDEHPDVAETWEVGSMPTLLHFVDGELERRASGVMSAREIQEWIATPILAAKYLPPITEPILGTTRRPTLVVRVRLAEAIVSGVERIEENEHEEALVDAEGATAATVRSFVKQLEDNGLVRVVQCAAEVDEEGETIPAHARLEVPWATKMRLRREVARVWGLLRR